MTTSDGWFATGDLGTVDAADSSTWRGSGEVDDAALVEHCRRGPAGDKVPARIVMLEAFPTVDGANGVKIQMALLRQMAIDITG